MTGLPRVSVLTPTFGRPELVVRAVKSALAQTVDDLEVIVVVDGRDDPTVAALSRFDDTRLRVMVPDRHLGNGGARNAALAVAGGQWVALLDDDDIWMPSKLERQLEAAGMSGLPHPIVSCPMVARNEVGDHVWPRRRPRPSEPLSEYLFRRTTPFSGEGIAQTSTLLTTRALAEAVPFDASIPRFVDLDWILRAARHPGVGLVFADGAGPLSVWSMEESRARVSTRADPRYAVDWARERRELFTPRAYAGFVLWIASKDAAHAGRRRDFLPLLWQAFRHGRPGPADLIGHVANFAISPRARMCAAAAYDRRTSRREATPVSRSTIPGRRP